MIELIFVIVILGILATVAIPKFAATRDDAKVSKIAQNIATAAAEISTYAMSKGTTDENFLVMSNAMKSLKDNGNARLSANQAMILAKGSDCIKVAVVKSATNDDLVVTFKTSTNKTCSALQKLIDVEKYPMKLRGTSVTY
jgi:general secretion pathway protein G